MPERPSVLVHFDHGRGPKAGADFSVDRDAFPYGYGACMDYLNITASENTAEGPAVRFIRRGAAFMLGFDAWHAFRNRHLINAADVVITHTEHEHLAIALLKIFRLVGDTAVVGQSIWLWDDWARTGPIKRTLYRRLLREIAVHSTHSPVNAAFGSQVLGKRVYLVPYGAHVPKEAVGADMHPTDSTIGVEVLAPGSDRHRDWRTLVEAARRAPDLRVTIVSRRLRARIAARRCADRVRVRAGTSFADVQASMRASSVIAIPLKSNMHVSGLTVLYEGLLAHRPVAMTATGGADFYGASHVDWAKTNDPDSLVEAIRSAHRRGSDAVGLSEGWKSIAERGLTLKDYGLRHVFAVWMALGRPVEPDLVSAARPIEPLVEQEARRLDDLLSRNPA